MTYSSLYIRFLKHVIQLLAPERNSPKCDDPFGGNKCQTNNPEPTALYTGNRINTWRNLVISSYLNLKVKASESLSKELFTTRRS